jgi:hypothetical protein
VHLQAGEQRPHDLREQLLEAGARDPRTEGARAERGLGDAEAASHRRTRQPEVDAVASEVALPDRLLQTGCGEDARAAEIGGHGLLQAPPVGGPEQWSHQLAHQRPLQRVTGVDRRHEVDTVPEHGSEKRGGAVGGDARDLRIQDRHRPRLQEIGGREERAQGGSLAGHPVVGGADAVPRAQAVRGQHRLGLDPGGFADDVRGAVARAPVGVEQYGPLAGEVVAEREVRGPHHRPHRGRVVERRHAHHDVDLAHRHQLPEQVVGEDARRTHG